MITRYNQFLFEHKFWGKNNGELLAWLDSKSKNDWVWFDSETSGLPNSGYEIQLTQVSCIVVRFTPPNNFEELDSYNKKIELTGNSRELMKDPSHRINWVLNFNHYDTLDLEKQDEQNTLQEFFEFLKQFNNPMLVIQNAEFDMRYLNTRHPIVKFDHEVLDTKQIIQLFYLPTLQKLAETEPEYAEMIKKIGTSDRDNGLISSSLSKVGPALGINMTGYHDALTDCRLMQQMFQKAIEFLKQHQDVDISKYQAERIKTKK